uniref:Uncharacterized protein n=1 Tax=Xiphophorus couchianus TaxID=32473 RepID=A0A3B5LDS6_9TELE
MIRSTSGAGVTTQRGPATCCTPLMSADCFSNDIHRLDTTTMVWSLINARVMTFPLLNTSSPSFVHPTVQFILFLFVVTNKVLTSPDALLNFTPRPTIPMSNPCPEQGMGDEFNLMDHSDLYILDFSPNLKTLCKIAVIQYSLEQSGLPHDIRWELAAMTTNSNISRPIFSSHG